MRHEPNDDFQEEGALDVGQAERILPRLEKDGIRFQIDTDVSAHGATHVTPFSDSRVTLFIHRGDLAAWRKLRGEYFPV